MRSKIGVLFKGSYGATSSERSERNACGGGDCSTCPEAVALRSVTFQDRSLGFPAGAPAPDLNTWRCEVVQGISWIVVDDQDGIGIGVPPSKGLITRSRHPVIIHCGPATPEGLLVGSFLQGLITFDTDLRLVCATSLRDQFAKEIVSENFRINEGRPLAIPTEAPGPQAEYLAWHRSMVFGRT